MLDLPKTTYSLSWEAKSVIEFRSLPCSRSHPRRCPKLAEAGVACRCASDMERAAPPKEEGVHSEKGTEVKIQAGTGF